MHFVLPSPLGMAFDALARRVEHLFARPERTAHRAALATVDQDVVRSLGKGELMVAPDPLGLRVDCFSGSLWITHDGDRKDLILEAGQSYPCLRNSRMLVYALAKASVRVVPDASAQ